MGDQSWGTQAPQQNSLGWRHYGGKSAALQALCWQDIPGVTGNAEIYFLTQVTSKEQEDAVAQERKPASAILLQAEKIWESHRLEAWKVLSSESPGWEGQHSPTRAAGPTLQQHKALT